MHWLDSEGLGRLPETIEPNIYICLEWFWNDEDLVQLNCLETRIRDQQSTARPIDIGLPIDSQFFSLVISISQSTG